MIYTAKDKESDRTYSYNWFWEAAQLVIWVYCMLMFL